MNYSPFAGNIKKKSKSFQQINYFVGMCSKRKTWTSRVNEYK